MGLVGSPSSGKLVWKTVHVQVNRTSEHDQMISIVPLLVGEETHPSLSGLVAV